MNDPARPDDAPASEPPPTPRPAPLKAPFPYPGGKSRVADVVWARLGNVENYLEPFAGSLAVLLRRPADHFRAGLRRETVTDVSHYLVNFWRAVTRDPEQVAAWCDGPVLEADLRARHRWLVQSTQAAHFRERMVTDPDYCDARIAGYWVWGACCWIGPNWCHPPRRPGAALPQQIPDLASGGRGVAGVGARPQLTDAFGTGRGVCGGPAAAGWARSAGDTDHPTAGTGAARRRWLLDWMQRLGDRLRLVRTCYGHWHRICDSPSTLTRLGRTGVVLDPPYPVRRPDGTPSRDDGLYASDGAQDLDQLRDEVLAWCRRWGGDDHIRIAVCGYEGDGYEALVSDGWSEFAWQTGGGYGNQRGRKSANAGRERIWFSPACARAQRAPSLFDAPEDEDRPEDPAEDRPRATCGSTRGSPATRRSGRGTRARCPRRSLSGSSSRRRTPAT